LLVNIQHTLGSVCVSLWVKDGMALMMPQRNGMTTYPRDIFLAKKEE
jgi:hypothetical protein